MNIKLKDIIDNKLSRQELKALHGFFGKGGTWQDVFQMTAYEIEEIYKKGYEFYQAQAFDRAKEAFLGLIHLNPYEARNWFSFACVLQAEKHYQEALVAFDIVLTIESENQASFFYSGQCAYALGETKRAKEFFMKTFEMAPSTELASKAALILELL